MTNRNGIIAYLLIAFGMAWSCWEISTRLGDSHKNPLFSTIYYMAPFAPAVATFVVRKWVTREGFADAGLRLNLRRWPYYLVAWLLPLPVVGFIVVTAPLLGLGTPDFSLVRGIKYMYPAGAPALLPQHLWMLVGVLLTEAIFAAPYSFGEEFGWRGYLQLRLFPDRPVLSAVVTGLIWGAWPLSFRGYSYPDNPLVGSLCFYPVGGIVLAIIFGWLRVKTGSVWSCSLAHAATNSIGASLTVLLFGGGASLLFVLYVGILGLIPLGALSAWIVFTGQLKPANEAAGKTKQAYS